MITVTIPVIFKEFVELHEQEYEAYYSYDVVHINTERYLSQLIGKTITGELSSTQLSDHYKEFENACEFLVSLKESQDVVVLGIER